MPYRGLGFFLRFAISMPLAYDFSVSVPAAASGTAVSDPGRSWPIAGYLNGQKKPVIDVNQSAGNAVLTGREGLIVAQ